MGNLKAKVEKEVDVGFQCSLCNKEYRAGYHAHLGPKDESGLYL